MEGAPVNKSDFVDEFVNRTGIEPWELREFHLSARSGRLSAKSR